MLNILAIFLGGGIGAVARYFSSEVAKKMFGTALLGTFFVNILGCFLIGYVFGITMNRFSLSPSAKFFITTGFLGGFTTFSTFSFEVFSLVKSGKYTHGIAYMLASIILGVIFSALGYYVSQWQIKI